MNDLVFKILKKINSYGYISYIVGGYQRDIYIGRKSNDYDICTSATPKELKEIFKNLIKSEQYGSVVLEVKNTKFEITTFRHDIKYINNRKPVEIEYVKTIEEDLKRRDFTMNTMCIDENGKLIDLMGAKKDIDKKIIKMVGEPNIKLKEDALRILRAIRFATVLNFRLDERLKESIIKHKDLLKNLSYYRKKEELDKIFSSPNVVYGIELIKMLGLSEPLELKNIEKLVPTTYLIGMWSQLNVLDKYEFNNTEKNTIIKIQELMNKNVLDYNNLYKYGLYISTIVGEIKGIDKKLINEKFNSLYIKNITEINIEAEEICKLLNKKPGNFLKDIFNDIEKKLVNKVFVNEKRVLKNYILQKYQ